MNRIRLKTIVVGLVCCELALLAVLGYVWRQRHKPSDVEPQQDAPSIPIGHATPSVPDAARELNAAAYLTAAKRGIRGKLKVFTESVWLAFIP